MGRCSVSFQPQGILAKTLWFGLFLLPADAETSLNFHPGSRPAVSKGHLRAAPRRDAWTEAALAWMRLGSWPCNTAYVAFIGNADGFPSGSSLLPCVAYEVQQQGQGRSLPAVHPDSARKTPRARWLFHLDAELTMGPCGCFRSAPTPLFLSPCTVT